MSVNKVNSITWSGDLNIDPTQPIYYLNIVIVKEKILNKFDMA